MLSNYEPGRVVAEKAFTSTSTDLGVASGTFKGNVIMTITGHSGRDISEFSKYPEGEVLYDKGARFHVIDKSLNSGTGIWTIFMREVG